RAAVQGARRRLAGLRADRHGRRPPHSSPDPEIHQRGIVVKAFVATATAASIALLLSACTSPAPPVEPLRPVRTAELRYGDVSDVNRYFATVASRYEVDQAFRVGGKVRERRVDLGQSVTEGDVLAVLDDVDYQLAEEAARQRFDAAKARALQAESDWQRLQALRVDGSVSASDEEHAKSNLRTARAAA